MQVLATYSQPHPPPFYVLMVTRHASPRTRRHKRSCKQANACQVGSNVAQTGTGSQRADVVAPHVIVGDDGRRDAEQGLPAPRARKGSAQQAQD